MDYVTISVDINLVKVVENTDLRLTRVELGIYIEIKRQFKMNEAIIVYNIVSGSFFK